MSEFDLSKIKEFYNRIPEIWASDDVWHTYSHHELEHYIHQHMNLFEGTRVLNAGSGGNDYGISCQEMYHVDIAEEKIKNCKNYIVSSIEKLSFPDESFDNIICVGSVLNYCDAFQAISELSRVLKKSGKIILEFESSWGYEYLNTKEYKAPVTVITLEYMHEQHIQWLFSPEYIYKILKQYNLKILEQTPFHILDGLLSKILSEELSVKLTKIDHIIKSWPIFRKHGNNIILLLEKSFVP